MNPQEQLKNSTSATLVKPSGEIPCQLAHCLFYNAEPNTKINRDRLPRDPADAQDWLNAGWNIGLPLGRNDLVAIDVDGAEGEAWVKSLGLPPTFSWRTRRGFQFLYRVRKGLRLSKMKPHPQVDFLAGNNYTIAPPSIADGVPREVLDDLPITQLSDSVLNVFRAPPVSAQKGSGIASDLPIPPGELIPEGRRYTTLNRREWALNWKRGHANNIDASKGPHADTLYAINAEYCDPPLDDAEVRAIIGYKHKTRPAFKDNPTKFVGENYPECTTKEKLILILAYERGLVYGDGKHIEIELAGSKAAEWGGMSQSTFWRIRRSLEQKGRWRTMESHEPTVIANPKTKPSPDFYEPTNRYLIPIPQTDDPVVLYPTFEQDKSSAIEEVATEDSLENTPIAPTATSLCHSTEKPSTKPNPWSNIFIRQALFDAFPDEPMSKLKANPHSYLTQIVSLK
jgi:hypothetical protein